MRGPLYARHVPLLLQGALGRDLRRTVGWKSVINTLTLYYEDRITINN